jgi:uncharacterized protein YndB with AHSA1/START domain
MSTDRIEKKILLNAPLKRVWRALSDAAEFGYWFGMKFNGPFKTGAVMNGVIAPTGVNAEVAAAQKSHEGKAFEIVVEQMVPERLFSFRWHPYAVEPNVDYSNEPMTLIEFALEQKSDGVLLAVTESGFDRVPLARRAKAFEANEGGWTMVVKMIGEYLAQKP